MFELYAHTNCLRNILFYQYIGIISLISFLQTSLYIDMLVSHPGKYIFVIEYYSDEGDRSQEMSIDVSSDYDRGRGIFNMPNCPYR